MHNTYVEKIACTTSLCGKKNIENYAVGSERVCVGLPKGPEVHELIMWYSFSIVNRLHIIVHIVIYLGIVLLREKFQRARWKEGENTVLLYFFDTSD